MMDQFQLMSQMQTNTIKEIENNNGEFWIKMIKLEDNKIIRIPCSSNEKMENIINKFEDKDYKKNSKFLASKEIEVNSSLIQNGIKMFKNIRTITSQIIL